MLSPVFEMRSPVCRYGEKISAMEVGVAIEKIKLRQVVWSHMSCGTARCSRLQVKLKHCGMWLSERVRV